jgi:ribosomal 30S subunit maturation factor RimM
MFADLDPIYFVHGLVRDGVYPYFSDHKMGVVTNISDIRRKGMIAIEEVNSRYIPMIFPVHSYCISIVFLYFRYIPIAF